MSLAVDVLEVVVTGGGGDSSVKGETVARCFPLSDAKVPGATRCDLYGRI